MKTHYFYTVLCSTTHLRHVSLFGGVLTLPEALNYCLSERAPLSYTDYGSFHHILQAVFHYVTEMQPGFYLPVSSISFNTDLIRFLTVSRRYSPLSDTAYDFIH